jgi:hypothetical protein
MSPDTHPSSVILEYEKLTGFAPNKWFPFVKSLGLDKFGNNKSDNRLSNKQALMH